MTTVMMAFVLAVGGVARICYLQMGRVERRAGRGTSGDSLGWDRGHYAGGDGSGVSSWFGSDNSGTGSHDSSVSSDAGGGDSADSSDSGGGGDSGGNGD